MTEFEMQVTKKKELEESIIKNRIEALDNDLIVVIDAEKEYAFSIMKIEDDEYATADFDWIEYYENNFVDWDFNNTLSKNKVLTILNAYCSKKTYHELLYDHYTSLCFQLMKSDRDMYRNKYLTLIDVIAKGLEDEKLD